MKINFLGDSITFGAMASSKDKSFVSLLKNIFPSYEINNYGISGTRIARQDELFIAEDELVPSPDQELANKDFNSRVSTMCDADYVFVFGGTNDYGHGYAPYGEMNDNTVYTFSGAVRVLIESLLKKYSKDHIKFILPLPRVDDVFPIKMQTSKVKIEKKTLEEYRKRIGEITKMYEIEVYDFSKEMGKPTSFNIEGNYADGLHPNDKGYQLLANLIAEKIKNFK